MKGNGERTNGRQSDRKRSSDRLIGCVARNQKKKKKGSLSSAELVGALQQEKQESPVFQEDDQTIIA